MIFSRLAIGRGMSLRGVHVFVHDTIITYTLNSLHARNLVTAEVRCGTESGVIRQNSDILHRDFHVFKK